jgi:hypothetical protein
MRSNNSNNSNNNNKSNTMKEGEGRTERCVRQVGYFLFLMFFRDEIKKGTNK